MKVLTVRQLQAFLAAIAGDYDVRVPVRLPDGTRMLARPAEGPLDIGPLPRKPVEVFFPQQGLVFTAEAAGDIRPPALAAKPLFVLGFTAADLAGLAFTDRFFAAGLPDDLYGNRRQTAAIVGIAGSCGAEGNRLPVAGGNCDLELIVDNGAYGVAAYTETGRALAARMRGEERENFPEGSATDSTAPVTEIRRMLQRASDLLLADRVPEAFWTEMADYCIACTACNLVCPTCTCFGVEDRCWPERTERSRMWDSCQLDGFMREASGHNPLGSEALRTRRRIHHKLAADVVRWGQLGCVACGRCDTACPTGIGMFAVAKEIVARYAEKK
ncbi:MAG: 4Fe-4S dicluster domain-containing protein [Desulfuromonadales bacterium]